MTIAEIPLSLDVSTARGTATPSGTTTWSWGDTVTAIVMPDAPIDGSRYACTGWTGTGSVPASGTGTNATFTIEEDSSLAWNWQKEHQISVLVSGVGTCAFGTQWVADGETVAAEIVPSVHQHDISVFDDSGGDGGVTLDGTTLTILADKPRIVMVRIDERKLSLAVSSAHGTAAPNGTTEWSWGDAVAASVQEPAPSNGVRQVCTGWVGTGSAPATGTATNVAFTIEEDSTLAWNWRKENQIAVSVAGDGTCAFGTQWVEDGTIAMAEIVPATHLYTIALAGDTNGVTLAGTTLAIPSDGPRNIAVTVTEVKLALDVSTAHGTPSPATGRTEWSWGNTVAASVAADESVDGVRWACTGWTGTGSAPTNGTAASATFTIEEDSTLTWNWEKQNQITVMAAGAGTCAFGTQWIADGTTAVATIVPTSALFRIRLFGDSDGVEVDGATISIPSDRPRMIGATVEEVDLALDVSTAFGTATPAAGRTTWSLGDTVRASVAAPEPADGVRQACTGWTGTGSVPASGTGTNVTFEIEEDSTLTWNWEEQVLIQFQTIDDASSGEETVWTARSGSAAEFSFTKPAGLFVWTIDGDTNGVVVDADGGFVSIPANVPRSVRLTIHEITVDEAVRTGGPVVWSTGGTWFVCEDVTASGGYSLRSGRIGAGETSAFEATVDGSGTLLFDWRISSARGHYAKFFLDGVETNSLTRSTEWATLSFELGSGTHTLRWNYEKGTGATAGEDAAFLDNVRWEPLALAEALDAASLVWTTGGDAAWVAQTEVSTDGEDAARSGAVSGEETSWLSTVVTNAGTLAWKWKADVTGSAGVDVWLDGNSLYDDGIYLEGASGWSDATLEIDGDGEHVVTFEFWNSGTAATIADCAYVDQVSWTPAKPEFVIVEGVTIPVAWLDENAETAVAAANGDYEAAARATAANGADKVWQCYLSGVSPTNAAERFLAQIAVTNGTADVWWTPDLNEGGTKRERVYTVEGKTNLVDQSWGPTNESTRFFRVKVSMP